MRMTCLAVGLSLAWASTAHAADADRNQLDTGAVLVTTAPFAGSDVPQITMRAVVDAAPDRVWSIIDHCGRYKDTMPRIKDSQELSRKGTTVRCKVTVNSPWPIKALVAVTASQHIVVPGKSWVRAWQFESGDYKSNVGSWTLTAFEGNPKRTLIVYQDHSEPTIWVPDWLLNYAIKKGLPSLVEKLRADVK
jgi:ribosome-associated toxin RatA of RatAB toxin-antitoxin module